MLGARAGTNAAASAAVTASGVLKVLAVNHANGIAIRDAGGIPQLVALLGTSTESKAAARAAAARRARRLACGKGIDRAQRLDSACK